MKYSALFTCATALLAISYAPSSMAQLYLPKDDVVSVKERPNTSLDALGIKAPLQMLVSPSIEAKQKFDDNIYRTNSNKESDMVTSVMPALDVKSDWKNHKLNLHASSDIGRYNDNESEDYVDYNLGANGRLDIMRNTYLTAEARFQHLHEDRSSPDNVGGNSPTEYDVITSRVGFTRDLARLKNL